MYIYKSTSTPNKTLSIPTSTPSTSTKKYTKVVLSKGVNLLVFGVPGLIDVVAYQNDKFEVCLPPHKTCNMILLSRFQKSSLYFSGGSDIVILFYIKKPFTRLVKEGTFITSHRGQLLNSKSEWHQAKVVRTRTEVVQGGLSEILHRKNFRTKLLHRHFHRISTVSDRNSKNEWKWRNLHCLQKIYTAAGSDGMDKSHLCIPSPADLRKDISNPPRQTKNFIVDFFLGHPVANLFYQLPIFSNDCHSVLSIATLFFW